MSFFLEDSGSGFDYDRIPDYVLHDAVKNSLSGDEIMLTGGRGTAPYNFRCPICGDSKTHKFKKRGYILHDKGWVYQCHNECGTMSFFDFLKDYHPEIHREVMFYGFANKSKRRSVEKDTRTEAEKTFVITGAALFKPGELIKVTDSHPVARGALQWCINRKIRKAVYEKWFVCLRDDKFKDRDINGNLIYNDKGFPTGNEYGNRIIIPYYRYGGKWGQFDARDLNPKSLLKYRNLSGASGRQAYNIDWLDTSQPFFLLEGAIDASFIQNAIGFGGTQHLKTLLEQRPDILANAHNGTVIWDNDDAGRDEMPWTIRAGFNWFNWSSIKPSPQHKYDHNGNLREIKDVNDLVLYTNAVEQNHDEFITYDSLKKYIEVSDGGLIKAIMLYGDRDQMRRERSRKNATEAKARREEKLNIKFNW